jgi:Flp pilus assembly protein TadD
MKSFQKFLGCGCAALLLAVSGCAQPNTGGPGQIGDNTLNVGWVALQSQNTDLALSVAGAVLKKVPNDPNALDLQSQAYYDQGKLDKAKATALSALAADQRNADAHLDLGRAIDQTDPASAAAQYQQALTLNPNLEDAYVDRGVAEAQLGNLDQAVTILNQATLLFTDDPTARLNLGIVLALRRGPGDVDRARGILSGLASGPATTPAEQAAWKYVQTDD